MDATQSEMPPLDEEVSDALKMVGFDPGVPVYVSGRPPEFTIDEFKEAVFDGTYDQPKALRLTINLLPGDLAVASMLVKQVEIIYDAWVFSQSPSRLRDCPAYCISGYLWRVQTLKTAPQTTVKMLVLRGAVPNPPDDPWLAPYHTYVQLYDRPSGADPASRLWCARYQEDAPV